MVLAVACGCGDDDAAEPADAAPARDVVTAVDSGDAGGGGDSGAADAGADAGPTEPVGCGEPPYVTVTTVLTAYGSGEAIGGAIFTSDICPGVSATTSRAGIAAARVTRDVPIVTRVTADGYLPTLLPEAIYADDLGGVGELYPEAVVPLLPHWDAAAPTILVRVFVDDTQAPPCDDASGHTLSVVGHPDAIVTYYAGTPELPMPDAALTATSALGAAEIAGLDATDGEARIELAVEKAGCEVSFASYPHTGRFALEDGVLTLAVALSPPRM